jgi:HlyD family secretion protein
MVQPFSINRSIELMGKRKGVWGLAGLAAVASVSMMVGGMNRTPSAPISSATIPAPAIKTVTTLGRLEPAGKVIKLSADGATQGSRLGKLLVKEGDRIKSGQVIGILESRDRLQAAVGQAKEQVTVAQAKLTQVKAGSKSGAIQAQAAKSRQVDVELQNDRAAQADEVVRVQAQWDGDRAAQEATLRRLKAALKNAQVELGRYRQLNGAGAIAKTELDSKQLTRDTAQQQIEEAQAVLERINLTAQRQISQAKTKLQRTKASGRQQVQEAESTLDQITEVRPVDVQVAQAEVESAIAAQQQAQTQLDQAYIKSPQNGVVLDIHTRPGEVISNTEGIIEIGRTTQMYAVAEVYQSDISKIRRGQTVRISSNALSGNLQGTVDRIDAKVRRQAIINTDPSENIDARVVEVHVRLDGASSTKAAQFTNLQVTAVIAL